MVFCLDLICVMGLFTQLKYTYINKKAFHKFEIYQVVPVYLSLPNSGEVGFSDPLACPRH